MGFVNKKDYATQTIDNSNNSRNNLTQNSDNSNNSSSKLKKSRQQLPDSYDPQIILTKPLLLEKNLLINDGHYKTTHQQNHPNEYSSGVNLKDMLKDNTNSNSNKNINNSKREINYFKKSRVKETTTTTNNPNYTAIVVHNNISDNNIDSSGKGKKQRK